MPDIQYRPSSALQLLAYVHALTDELGFENPASAESFANHFAVEIVEAHRDGVVVADAADSLRAEAESWLAYGECTAQQNTSSVEVLAAVKDHVVLSLKVSEKSADGTIRLTAEINPNHENGALHGPACAAPAAVQYLGFEIEDALGIEFDLYQQPGNDQVEFDVDESIVDRIPDFPSIMRARGWTVEASGGNIGEEREFALAAHHWTGPLRYQSGYEARLTHIRAQQTLGAARRLLQIVDPTIEIGERNGATTAEDIARVTLAMKDQRIALFAAVAERFYIDCAINRRHKTAAFTAIKIEDGLGRD